MSSGSSQTILAAGVFVVCAGFVAAIAMHRPVRGASHLVVPSPAESAAAAPSADVLRVCSDPNNLPFSNDKREGFENRIAAVIGRELGRRVAYYWQPQRRGFVRNTLNAGACDVVAGIEATAGMVRTTRPYYRSTFMFVTRAASGPVRSFDDPRLRGWRIGIPVTGGDSANPPPAQALAARGMTSNVRGYTVYGDYSRPSPLRGLIDAVASGDVDVAVAWGPIAGYFAAQQAVTLTLAPVPPEGALPFAFDIAMGVRKQDAALASAIDTALVRRADDIGRILDEYHVPRLTLTREESRVARARP
jgi:mxaJ protein